MKLTRHFGPIVYLGIGGLYGKIFKGTAFNFCTAFAQRSAGHDLL